MKLTKYFAVSFALTLVGALPVYSEEVVDGGNGNPPETLRVEVGDYTVGIDFDSAQHDATIYLEDQAEGEGEDFNCTSAGTYTFSP